jgi:hypothetical protein
MKRKLEQEILSDEAERQAVNGLKERLRPLKEASAPVSGVYWANLLVKTNRRIDDATSAKALSISWAARVAIPGMIAILFFFIGLHYYAPDLTQRESSVLSLVKSLPQDAVDSLLVHPERFGTALTVADVPSDIFQFSGDQITEYLSELGSEQVLIENMNDVEVSSLLAALDARKNL